RRYRTMIERTVEQAASRVPLLPGRVIDDALEVEIHAAPVLDETRRFVGVRPRLPACAGEIRGFAVDVGWRGRGRPGSFMSEPRQQTLPSIGCHLDVELAFSHVPRVDREPAPEGFGPRQPRNGVCEVPVIV